MKDSGTFVQSLVAADANNIITVVDFNQILSPYKEFEIDYIVSHAIVLEDFQIKCGLFSLLEADVPTTNALASQASQGAEDARIKKEGQKIYLDIFHAYGNGPWIQKAEEILQNKNSLEQAWALMAPAFSTNETALIDEDLKIGVRVSSKAQGVGGLKGNDYLRIFGSWRKVTTFHKKKDNSVEALQDRISALELLLGIFGAPSVTLPGSNGLVPAPPVGGGNFLLRGDRSWENPAIFATVAQMEAGLNTTLKLTGAQTVEGNKTFNGSVLINNTTSSTSTTTGALVVLGGLGCAQIKTLNAWLHEPRSGGATAIDANNITFGQYAGTKWIDGGQTNSNVPINAGMLQQFDSLFTTASQSKYRVQEYLAVGASNNARFWKRTENNGNWGNWLEIAFLEKNNTWTGVQNFTTQININGVKVLSSQETGWTAGTGTPNKGAFNADTATLLQTAQRVLALGQALRNHGLINS